MTDITDPVTGAVIGAVKTDETAPRAETKLTIADLDKAAAIYEAAIDALVLFPSADSAGKLRDLMDGLDALDAIRCHIEGGGRDSDDDDSYNDDGDR